MSYPSKDEILASSKGWVASFLNFLPGLGSGYLYQRRWTPYFLTLAASTAWFALGFFLKAKLASITVTIDIKKRPEIPIICSL